MREEGLFLDVMEELSRNGVIKKMNKRTIIRMRRRTGMMETMVRLDQYSLSMLVTL